MAQADVQTLVDLLSSGQFDVTLFPQFYADVMNDLGAQNWHTSEQTLAVSAGNNPLNLSPNLLNLLGVIFGTTAMWQLTLRELESLNINWRNTTGTPNTFTMEALGAKSIELAPPPASPGTLYYFQSETRTAELPYLTLPMALKVLWREYKRESDHQDLAYAAWCNYLADLILNEMLAGGGTP